MKEFLIYNICYLKLRVTKKNIFITLTNIKGDVIVKISSGMLKRILKISLLKRKTAHTSRLLFNEFSRILKEKKIVIKLLVIKIEGFLLYGPLKSMIKLIAKDSYFKNVCLVEKRNRISHNGMRLRKPRRK